MSLWSRIRNVFRAEQVSREIEEEIEAHIADALEHGRDPAEARRAVGAALHHREHSRDIRVLPWLDSVYADAVFGWRQLKKNKVTSAAAILSLGLAIGSCTSAFRLTDALLLRPLPVANPDLLYEASRHGIGPEGRAQSVDEWAYPMLRDMRAAVKDDADLIAIGPVEPTDVTFASDQEMEKAFVQHVGGRMFASFGLRPATGRLLTENDDREPGAHPYAVLSYDYWSRRLGRDESTVGRTFRMNGVVYQIAGVVEPPFTGTETGTVTDIFLSTMMHPWVTRSDATWARAILRLRPGTAIGPLRAKLQAVFQAFERERLKSATGLPKSRLDSSLNQTIEVEPAASGVSGMQRNLRLPLIALGVLVALVLLIACANVANLLTAQAASRAREMALRVSIGAGRWRLAQLVLVESAWLAILAAIAGTIFAWWSAPFVVSRINPPENPARLYLPADWRVTAFGLALTVAVTLLFGLAPALRAANLKPASTLKGGEDPHAKRRLMHGLIVMQAAFCFMVLFVAGLFSSTLDRLSHQPTGFSADRVLTLDTVTPRPQAPAAWEQVLDRVRAFPGVESAALADWALLNGNSRNNFIGVSGGPSTDTLAYFRYVSPGWLDAMRIPLIDGRDFRPTDTSPGMAIVNQEFARVFFHGENPVGKIFRRVGPAGSMQYQIAGFIGEVRYRSMREPMLPVVLVPLRALDSSGVPRAIGEGTFVVRTASADPLALATALRREIAAAGLQFRVSNVRTQAEINRRHTVRERLMATLAVFFAIVALLLAAVGLYGVLDYSVVQRRREIGIRMAIGAPAADIARRLTWDAFSMVLAGAAAGLALGMVSVRYIETLLYGVKPTDAGMLAVPWLVLLLVAMLAAAPAAIRAVRIDPAATLRAD
jgi:predicted permease